MNILRYDQADFAEKLQALYGRPAYPPEAEKSSAQIIADIRKNGDRAVATYAEKFDHVKLTPEQFRLTEAEIAEAIRHCPASERRALRQA